MRALSRTTGFSRSSLTSRPLYWKSVRRHLASVAKQPLTLHHKLSSLLPRILDAETLDLWKKLLDHAYNGLSGSDLKSRVVVYGVDEYSGAHDLVTALLEDTISYSPEHAIALHNRPRSRTLIIEHAQNSQLQDENLKISSQWLQQFSKAVQVIEISNSDVSQHLETLLAADFPVVVVNPITTPLKSFTPIQLSILSHPNSILVITGVQTPEIDAFVKSAFPEPEVLYINPSHALNSLQAFKADPTSLKSIDTYQYGSIVSGINDLTKVIKGRFDCVGDIQKSTAVSILERSLDASRTAVEHARVDTDRICDTISQLKTRIEDTKARVEGDVLRTAGKDNVREALEKAKSDVQLVMDQLKWWKLLWRVDDIAEIVGSTVDRAWCKDLERQLILHTGRLSALQQELTSLTEDALAAHPQNSHYRSHVLSNELSQLKASPTYSLTPTSLTGPLQKRKTQLAAYPTTRLHVRAQQTVLGVYGSVIGGVGLSWTGWVGLSEQLFGLGTESSVGVGLLGAALGVRWGVARWEKAKKRWWEDWERVGDGLGRDLKVNLESKVQKNVVTVPAAACDRLDAMVRTRTEQLAEVEEQIDNLRQESIAQPS